jgi:hypothetical protein
LTQLDAPSAQLAVVAVSPPHFAENNGIVKLGEDHHQ